MKGETREPIQKRSIKKRDKILHKGFDLILEKGYYNTNTAEIAKAAGVSTGLVYSYFEDKHDILLQGFKAHADKIFYPIFEDITKGLTKDNTEKNIHLIIKKFISSLAESADTHSEIMSLIYSDQSIAEFFHDSEMEMTDKICTLLIERGFDQKGLKEKVHLLIGIIDYYCHEVIFHKHDKLDYDIMEDKIVEIIRHILEI